jgi:hypothetical protein
MARRKNAPLTEKDLLAGLQKLNQKPEDLGFKGPLKNILGEQSTAPQDAAEVEDESSRTERLQRMAGLIQEKVGIEQGISPQTKTNSSVFEKFIQQTQQRDKLLQDATDEQIKIFDQIEKTLIDLAKSSATEGRELRRTLDRIAGELGETDQTPARGRIADLLNTARTGARPATFGRAFSALFGGESQLKSGYTQSGGRYFDRSNNEVTRDQAQRSYIGTAAGLFGGALANASQASIDRTMQKADANPSWFDRFLGRIGNRNSEARNSKLGVLQGAIDKLREGAKNPAFKGMAAGTPNSTAPAGGAPDLTNSHLNVNAKDLQAKTQTATITAQEVTLNADTVNNNSKNGGLLDALEKYFELKGLGDSLKKTPKTGPKTEPAAEPTAEPTVEPGPEKPKLPPPGEAAPEAEKAAEKGILKKIFSKAGLKTAGKFLGRLSTAYALLDPSDLGNGELPDFERKLRDNAKPGDEPVIPSLLQSAPIEPGGQPNQAVTNMTKQNNQMEAEVSTAKPIIINNTTPAPAQESRNPAPAVVMPRANVRPDEDALSRYTNRGSMFY